MAGGQREINMTQGTIWKQIVLFSIPLLIGNLFQMLYNTVDSVVVGHFVGKEALAAVGSTGSIINSLVGFFMGVGGGAGVVISRFYGAQDRKNLSKAVHTTIVLTLISGIICTVLGSLFVPQMLRLMSTPEDVIEQSTTYLRIYFYGVSALMLYNMGSSILRAVGDSRRPLYFLCISALTNIALDLLFVVVFHWGIAGVAWATLIAQAISALLVLLALMRTDAPYAVHIGELAVDRPIMGEIVRIGLPGGLQSCILSFSNIFVQGYINAFGSTVMAGQAAYSKLESFIALPKQSIQVASSVFVGQNLGAGDLARTKRGVRISLWICCSVTALLSVLAIIFSTPLIGMFATDESVLETGKYIVLVMAPFMVTTCFGNIYAGVLSATGRSAPPSIISVAFYVVFRQIYLFIITRLTDSLGAVMFGFPLAWMLASLTIAVYYFRCHWEKDIERWKKAA